MEPEKTPSNLSKKDVYIKNLDIFRELGNICAGGAGNILSKLIKKKIYFDIPPAKYLSISQIIKGRLIENQKQMCLHGTIKGFFQGKIFLMTPIDETEILLENLYKVKKKAEIKKNQNFNSNDNQILHNFFKKLINAYTDALASFLQVSLMFDEEQFITKQGSDFKSCVASTTDEELNKAITIETTIKVENEEIIHCSFLFILGSSEVDTILNRIEEIW
ncbi:hypothetical protein NEF87_000399 [Candidatus Lokiarchaeum ossiferum]|uniref:CheC-like protein domain-containing protein n=1 Tax=Candidatus Lokiarchaeum ossiferum TaxID=2951803 RepID=A0ABY6HNP8_9ARCH|nr:hypothetical protein NEF87_000399 [Candidatus Lokiarchaeum sp. B-35]